jgi:transposase-like protein
MKGNEHVIYSKKNYSEELKQLICTEHIEEGTGLNALKRKYNLSSHSLIHCWLREYGYIKSDLIEKKKSSYIGVENFSTMPEKKESLVDNSLISDEQNLTIIKLKKELEEARLLTEAYKRIIEIAETDLKIPIRKKYNTK